MKAPLAAALILLSACAEESADTAAAGARAAVPAASAKAPSPPAAGAAARSVKEETALLDLTYGWPAEAAAIPALNERLESDLARDREDALATASEDKAARGADTPFHGHYLSKVWESHGATPRLLSLAAELGTFTGGAHGNVVFEPLLWDREAGRPIVFLDLFGEAGAIGGLSGTWCAALDKARAEKRQETLPLSGEGWMVECPPLKEQVVVPVDGDGNGRFERLSVLVPPYEAGPYAEGSYVIDLAVTDALRAGLRAEYAGSFEVK